MSAYETLRGKDMGLGHDVYYAIDACRLEHSVPTGFRIAEYPDGSRRVQGGYQWHQGMRHGMVWRDLPLVKVDDAGQAIE